MIRYKHHIEQLKAMTAKRDAQFADLVNYFMDYISENPEAMNASKPIKSKDNFDFFKALLTPVTSRYNTEAKAIYLMQVNKTPLVHGTVALTNSSLISLYYFKDIETGLVFFHNQKTGMMDFFRITAFIMPANESVQPPTPVSTTLH